MSAPSVTPRRADEEERELVALGQLVLLLAVIALVAVLILWALP